MKNLTHKDFLRRSRFSRLELSARVVRAVARNPIFLRHYPRLTRLLAVHGNCRSLIRGRCFFSYGRRSFNSFFRSNRFFSKYSIAEGFFGSIRKTGF